VHASDAVYQSNVEGESDRGSHNCSCYFGPSTVTVSGIREMSDQGYFIKGGARAPGEETIPESESDGAVIFEEFL
jgi:hypothetical protein